MHAKKGGLSTNVSARNSMKATLPKEMIDFDEVGNEEVIHSIQNRLSQSLKGINSVSSDENVSGV